MSNICKISSGSCPAPWVLGGAILGLVVGMLTDNIGMWIGIGVAIGVALGLTRRSFSCCGSDKSKDSTGEGEVKE